MHYHVRTACGVTIDWLPDRAMAIRLAENEGLQVYAVNAATGIATRIK